MKHCSNCGERIVEGQQFCRSCGAELLFEGRRSRIHPRTLINIGAAGTFAGVLVAILGAFLSLTPLAIAGAALIILALGAMAAGGLLNEIPTRSRGTATEPTDTPTEQPALEKADTTNRLPPRPADDHFPPSVTEQTTTKLVRK